MEQVVTFLKSITSAGMSNALIPLVAAFGGSFAAFLLENGRRKRTEKKANRAAGNEALLALGFYWNEIELFKINQIAPFRENPRRHIQMPPVLLHIEQSYKLNFQALQFVIDQGDVDLINRLSVSERLFMTTVDLIGRRSKLHVEKVQPKLDAAGFGPNDQFTLDQLADILGPRIDGTLRQMTDDTIVFTDDASVMILKTYWELRRNLKEIFPKEKFIISVPKE